MQIYLQNRRQRDAKNKSVAVSINSAKEKAKSSIAAAQLGGIGAQEGATEPTEGFATVENAFAAVADEQSAFEKYHQVSSDALESMRSFQGLSGQSIFTFSSPHTLSLHLDELDTPSRPVSQLRGAGTDERPTSSVLYLDSKLWTRILSSPPSPASSRRRLYETLRQSFLAQPTESRNQELSESLCPAGVALETVSVNLPTNEGKTLERKSSKIDLACAMARDGKAGSKPTQGPSKAGEPNVIEGGRARTMSGVKRMREETNENEAPRKRTAPLTWSGYVSTPVAYKAGLVIEDFSTPETTIAPSSCGSSAAPSISFSSSSLTLSADPIQGLHSSVHKQFSHDVPSSVRRIDALSELEANAALVLASLSYNV